VIRFPQSWFVVIIFVLYFESKTKNDVTVINAEAGKELTLDAVESIGSVDITLLAGAGTSYIFKYGDFTSILNLTESVSFTINGGILKCAPVFDISLFLIIVSSETATLTVSNAEIVFIGEMNSLLYMVGGTIVISKLKIDNQRWVSPLIDISPTNLTASLSFSSCNITNSVYQYSGPGFPYKSAVIFFNNKSNNIYNLSLTSSLFENNSFSLAITSYGFGGVLHMWCRNENSGVERNGRGGRRI
jgi:hypothetical protein